ncbi:MAG: signal recognition particle-docking protein FtsY [Pseudomonadota bacterium]
MPSSASPPASSSDRQTPSGFLGRLRRGLASTGQSLARGLAGLTGGAPDAKTIEDLETALLSADVGVDTTRVLLDAIQRRMSRRELADGPAVAAALRSGIRELLAPCEAPLHPDPAIKPYVILAVGVNGAGKTTTLAKLAAQLQQDGRRVLLAAADTFRAAAIEQLQSWGDRLDIPVIAQHTGADAAAVAHDAIAAARARNVDVLIVDTAGRQHTHRGLMDELRKIRRVLDKAMPGAPHEVLMVLDAGTGQNALSQLKHFHEAVNVTGLVVTKLDGTARGGVLIAIARAFRLPVRFVGVGESIEDLLPFRADDFVDSLIPER